MHRVELKGARAQGGQLGLQAFLMHRVELKAQVPFQSMPLLERFLMHRVELKAIWFQFLFLFLPGS